MNLYDFIFGAWSSLIWSSIIFFYFFAGFLTGDLTAETCL